LPKFRAKIPCKPEKSVLPGILVARRIVRDFPQYIILVQYDFASTGLRDRNRPTTLVQNRAPQQQQCWMPTTMFQQRRRTLASSSSSSVARDARSLSRARLLDHDHFGWDDDEEDEPLPQPAFGYAGQGGALQLAINATFAEAQEEQQDGSLPSELDDVDAMGSYNQEVPVDGRFFLYIQPRLDSRTRRVGR
jgi:hypothetical protein